MSTQALWISVLVLVVFGYLYMLLLLGMVILAAAVYCLHKAWSEDQTIEQQDKQTSRLARMPLVNQLDSYRLRRYE